MHPPGKPKRLEKFSPPGSSEKQKLLSSNSWLSAPRGCRSCNRSGTLYLRLFTLLLVQGKEGFLSHTNPAEEPWASAPSSVCQAGWAGRDCPWSPRTTSGANGLCWVLRVEGLCTHLRTQFPRPWSSGGLLLWKQHSSLSSSECRVNRSEMGTQD